MQRVGGGLNWERAGAAVFPFSKMPFPWRGPQRLLGSVSNGRGLLAIMVLSFTAAVAYC